MPMTQAQAIIQVRARIDEEDATVGFTLDSQIRAWLNEGVREVARRALWKKTSTTIPAIAGTQFYTAPANVIQAYRLEFAPSGSSQIYPLEYSDINAMDAVWGTAQAQNRSIPESYTLVSSNPLSVQLYPTPSQAGTLKLYFYAMPTDLATTDTSSASTNLDVPAGWEDLVVEYATGLAERKARDMASYQATMTCFNNALSNLLNLATRYTDEATYVSDAWAGFYDYY